MKQCVLREVEDCLSLLPFAIRFSVKGFYNIDDKLSYTCFHEMSSISVDKWTVEYYIANQTLCQQMLKNPDVWKEIPLLNSAPLCNFKDKQLVRFRGMIQDMYDPEYYLEQYEVKTSMTGESDIRCGLYIDIAHCLPHEEVCLDSDKNKHSMRNIYVVILTPGLNNWTREKEITSTYISETTVQNDNVCKRSLNNTDSEKMDCSESVTKKVTMDDINESKNDVHYENRCQTIFLDPEFVLSFPFRHNDNKPLHACIVKVYDDLSLKLSKDIDIIGFVSLDPRFDTLYFPNDETSTCFSQTSEERTKSFSIVPKLHAIKVIEHTKEPIVYLEIVPKAQLIRNDLHLLLSQLLFGDYIAAEYVMYNLISSIYYREDITERFCLGAFPVNITNISVKHKTFPKEFYKFLTHLVKKSHFLDLTLENLNHLNMIPKKIYKEHNWLKSGILQLSDHTHLVINETGLTLGGVKENGVNNYKALAELVKYQKLTYDLKYCTLEHEADIPILIFSDAKSFIPCPIQVCLNVDAKSENIHDNIFEAAYQYIKDETRLMHIRQYLEALKHAGKIVLTKEAQKMAEEECLEFRNGKYRSRYEFDLIMVLARSVALCRGKMEINEEIWRDTLKLEKERRERLSMQKES